MTGLILQVLGLLSTGLIYPSYQGLEDVNEFMQVQQQIIEDEAERNYYEEQKQIIIEDYFLFTKRFPKTRYSRGCAGGYENATYKDGKRHQCSKTAFDCAGMMKAYGYLKGIITKKEIGLYNSSSLYELGTPKDPRDAERGDFMYWRGYGDRGTGNSSTHFAVVSREYSGGTIGVWDYTKNVPGERILKVSCNKNYCNYAGRFRIFIATNGFVETALNKKIEVQPRVVNTNTGSTEVMMSKYDPKNPMGFTATVTGYDYDSLANRITTLRWNYNHDKKMIAKFIAEGHFNSEAIGKKGERGMCQLLYNKTNKVWIDDPRRSDPMRQAQICAEKWEAVPEENRDLIRHANEDTEIDNIFIY